MPLHLTKVAVGVASVEALENRIARRLTANGELRVATRMRPKRMAELVGGSLHWIVKHRIVARNVILRFDDRSDGRIDIVCAGELLPCTPLPKRAHQGWRYLAEEDAPGEGGDEDGMGALPPRMYAKLAGLGLV
jgi:hypothetical protein